MRSAAVVGRVCKRRGSGKQTDEPAGGWLKSVSCRCRWMICRSIPAQAAPPTPEMRQPQHANATVSQPG
eukprot:1130137-Rhodomonas_salina.1